MTTITEGGAFLSPSLGMGVSSEDGDDLLPIGAQFGGDGATMRSPTPIDSVGE